MGNVGALVEQHWIQQRTETSWSICVLWTGPGFGAGQLTPIIQCLVQFGAAVMW